MPAADPRDTCVKCGYSLHTLADSSACPECGTSVKQSRETSRFTRARHRFVARIPGGWKTIVATPFVLFILAIAWLTYNDGRVAVAEFCPQTFQMRTRVWYVIPYFNWPVTRKTAYLRDTDLSVYLREQGFVPANAQTSTWYFCWGSRHGRRGWIGTAKNAARSFDHQGADWIRWSNANPISAKVVWPIVLKEAAVDDDGTSNAAFLLGVAECDEVEPEKQQNAMEKWILELRRPGP